MIGLAIIVSVVALESGWVLVPEWYQKPSFRSHQKSMAISLGGISASFEKTNIPPPEEGIQILEEKSDRWGTPIQYSYENNEPTLRAAGKDRELNTKDDIIQKVRITTS